MAMSGGVHATRCAVFRGEARGTSISIQGSPCALFRSSCSGGRHSCEPVHSHALVMQVGAPQSAAAGNASEFSWLLIRSVARRSFHVPRDEHHNERGDHEAHQYEHPPSEPKRVKSEFRHMHRSMPHNDLLGQVGYAMKKTSISCPSTDRSSADALRVLPG